jgi:hypothetical protein
LLVKKNGLIFLIIRILNILNIRYLKSFTKQLLMLRTVKTEKQLQRKNLNCNSVQKFSSHFLIISRELRRLQTY